MQEHDKWLRIVSEDLLAAKLLLKGELYGSVAYHCQQAAEKALKAYLVFNKCIIIKTHDLIRLLELCMKLDAGFEKLFVAVDYINPFSTKFRYPTEYDIPDHNEAELAIKQARKILKFVVKKIEEPKTDQMKIFK